MEALHRQVLSVQLQTQSHQGVPRVPSRGEGTPGTPRTPGTPVLRLPTGVWTQLEVRAMWRKVARGPTYPQPHLKTFPSYNQIVATSTDVARRRILRRRRQTPRWWWAVPHPRFFDCFSLCSMWLCRGPNNWFIFI